MQYLKQGATRYSFNHVKVICPDIVCGAPPRKLKGGCNTIDSSVTHEATTVGGICLQVLNYPAMHATPRRSHFMSSTLMAYAFAENAISLQQKNLKRPYKKETRRGITNVQ